MFRPFLPIHSGGGGYGGGRGGGYDDRGGGGGYSDRGGGALPCVQYPSSASAVTH